jgi:hypothetical protein
MRLAHFPVKTRPNEEHINIIFIAPIFISFLYLGFGLFHVTKGFYRNRIADDNPLRKV